MSQLREIYKCNHCGLVTEIVAAAAPTAVCCGEPMEKLEAKPVEAEGKEKHIPVIEEIDGGVKVKVGSVEHPMLDEHYINFIEVLMADKVARVELKPGQKPETTFKVSKADIVEVREYCNVHGLWKA